MNGLLCLYKPAGITSYDCIRHIKNLLPEKIKIGHSGTLDPFADGLLIIGIGSATKELHTLLETTKTYVVTAKLGERTDTLDLTGTLVETQSVPADIDFVACAQRLMPSYEQTPPVYSNVKFNGRALHKLARAQRFSHENLEEIAETRKKNCSIFELHVMNQELPLVTFEAKVSKGTYVRSLTLDIAQHGGTVATVQKLTRTQIGDITLSQAVLLDKLTNSQDVIDHFLKKATLL